MVVSQAPVVGSIEVQGKIFDVRCTDIFRFTATVGKVVVWGDNADQLKMRLSIEVARQRIEHEIPVVLMRHDAGSTGYVRAVLRGTNSRTGAYLFTLESGQKISEAHPQIVARTMPNEGLAEANRLVEARDAARATLTEFLRVHCESSARENLAAWALLKAAEEAAGIKE